jgi:hypothetical protein
LAAEPLAIGDRPGGKPRRRPLEHGVDLGPSPEGEDRLGRCARGQRNRRPDLGGHPQALGAVRHGDVHRASGGEVGDGEDHELLGALGEFA